MAGRLTIIGGGVMGLMTAYYTAPRADAATVLERPRVGDGGWLDVDAGFADLAAVTRVLREGYKFAPWVGTVLAQLAVRRGTVYDIGRFTPARFAGGAPVRGVVAS